MARKMEAVAQPRCGRETSGKGPVFGWSRPHNDLSMGNWPLQNVAALLQILHITPIYLLCGRLPWGKADASTLSIDGAKLGPSGLLRGGAADLADHAGARYLWCRAP